MIEELSHVSASFPTKKQNQKKSKSQAIDYHERFDPYFKGLEQKEVMGNIWSLKYKHLVRIQHTVKTFIQNKMKEQDHMNSYRFSLIFVDYDNEDVKEKGLVHEEMIRSCEHEVDPVNPDFQREVNAEGMNIVDTKDPNSAQSELFTYFLSSGKLNLEGIIKDITDFRNECEAHAGRSLKKTRNLVWELRHCLNLKNDELVNMVKILDEDIFEKQHYPNLRFFIVLHAEMTYQYNVNKPKVFVQKYDFNMNQEVIYQTLYNLMKKNILPTPVFSIGFIKELVATRLTYPSIKSLEEDWLFLKRLHTIKIRRKLPTYYRNLYYEEEGTGDKLTDELTDQNNLFMLGISIYKYLSQIINENDLVFTNMYDYMTNHSLKSDLIIKKITQNQAKKSKNKELDKEAFKNLVAEYQAKISYKIKKYSIKEFDELNLFFDTLKHIQNGSLPGNKTPGLGLPALNKAPVRPRTAESRTQLIESLNNNNQNEVRVCMSQFQNLAKKLVDNYTLFAEKFFKDLYVTDYHEYEKIVNPDICGSIVGSLKDSSNYDQIQIIIRLFYTILCEIKEKQPTYILYDKFKVKLVNAYPEYDKKIELVDKFFYYCHQMYIHIGIMSVNPKTPFYFEVMHI